MRHAALSKCSWLPSLDFVLFCFSSLYKERHIHPKRIRVQIFTNPFSSFCCENIAIIGYIVRFRHLYKCQPQMMLAFEKGRYFRPKIKRENRLCSRCNQIEDEQHFLIHCTKFVDVRKLLFQKLLFQKPARSVSK